MIEASIIIPVYNASSLLEELWLSLVNQSFDLKKIEFIFVDNNSEDNSLEILKGIAESNSDLLIKVLSENDIQSSYAARNKGIINSSSDIILFTDSDCLPQADWIESMLEFFSNNQDAYLVAGAISSYQGSSLLEKYAEKKEFLSQKHTFSNKHMPYAQTANLALKKEVFSKIGLFRPYLKSGGDADICWRFQMAYQEKVFYNTDGVVMHKHRINLSELFKQWSRYGRAQNFLAELYGIEPRKKTSVLYYLKEMVLWLFIYLPKSLIQFRGLVDSLETPLGLFCIYASDFGYSRAKFKKEFLEIPEFSN